MIDKDCFRFLKLLYKKGSISIPDARVFFGHARDSKNQCIQLSALLSSKLIILYEDSKKSDGEGGFFDSVVYYKITVAGRAYIEQKRRDFWNFWIPYAITTFIALLSLFVTLHNSVADIVCKCCLT